MAEFATSGGHWYQLGTGEPRYSLIGKNGKERPTTLRDARTLGLVPSVTTVNKMAAAPALQAWMLRQVLLSAATLPKVDNETADAWVDRVNRDWRVEADAARASGEQIHGAIEKHIRDGMPDAEYYPWVAAVRTLLDVNCGPQQWHSERSFASDLGYGGKVDLHSDQWVIDFKTKDGPADGRKLWDDEAQQLSAYRRGLQVPGARCAIIHIDRNQPHAEFIEATEEQLERGVAMFDCLLELWKVKNNYRPEAVALAA